MKKFLFFLLLVLNLTGCNRREPNQLERTIAEALKEANNKGSYKEIQPFLSKEFHFKGSDVNTSFTLLYSYLHFSSLEKISKIEIDYAKDIGDSLFELNGSKYFENYGAEELELVYKLTKDGPEIIMLDNLKPHKLPLTTRASYVGEEIFGEDPVRNIINLNVLDKSSADSINNFHYTIFYDEQLKAESENALLLFKQLDSLLISGFEINDIEREDLFLTNITSNNTITIGKDRDIPWTMALYESDSINNLKLINKIGHTFSHEIIEGTLVHSYNLEGYKYRWFRDGLSDYLAFRYCTIVAPEVAKEYFIEDRLSSAAEFAGSGNLLDWRGNGPIEGVDKGKLYGTSFIYFNEVSQYGRAFKFFKDVFEENENELIEVLKNIDREEDISVEKVLDIMSQVTGQNIEQLISEY